MQKHFPVNRDGLVGWWAYKNTGSVSALGTWKDYSGNGNHGAGSGTAKVDSNGAVMDGNGYYQIPDSPLFDIGAGDFSFVIDIKCSRPVDTESYLACHGSASSPSTSFYIAFHNEATTSWIQIWARDTSGTHTWIQTTGINIADNVKRNIAFVKTGTSKREVYVNGELNNTDTSGNGIWRTINYPFYVGTVPGNPGYIGVFDDITWYNRVLSDKEIKLNYERNRRI